MDPVWDVPNPKLYHPYDQEWDSEDQQRFMLVPDFPIGTILKNLDSSYNLLFNSQGLINPHLNKKKIEGIKERWALGLPIDPPILFWDSVTKSAKVENGIHRLNCALSLKAKQIPVLIYRIDFAIFCHKLILETV